MVAYLSENGSAELLMLIWERIWGVFIVALGSLKKHSLILSLLIIQIIWLRKTSVTLLFK